MATGESILSTIRQMVGGEENATYFDTDLKVHINAALFRLYQLGVGSTPYEVTDETNTWNDFLGEDYGKISLIKQYVYYFVRNAFDPPQTSFVLSSINDKIKELEWEINIEVDPKLEGGEDET